MKKMLIMAMAVFALMACNKSSETGLPRGEAKALNATTVGAIDALGDSPAEVDKALTSAGFKKIEGGYNPLHAPARAAVKKDSGDEAGPEGGQVMYAYGLPDDYAKMTAEQAIAWLNNAIADGKAIMLVKAVFEATAVNVKLDAISTTFAIKKSAEAYKSFTATSDDMYKKLSSKKVWEGSILEDGFSAIIFGYNTRNRSTPYLDHSSFVSAIAKAEGIAAIETGASSSGTNDFAYENAWVNPSAEEEKELLNYGLEMPICLGHYSVGSVDYDNEY